MDENEKDFLEGVKIGVAIAKILMDKSSNPASALVSAVACLKFQIEVARAHDVPEDHIEALIKESREAIQLDHVKIEKPNPFSFYDPRN